MLTSDPCGVYIFKISRGPASAALLNKPGGWKTDNKRWNDWFENSCDAGIGVNSLIWVIRSAPSNDQPPLAIFFIFFCPDEAIGPSSSSIAGSTTLINLVDTLGCWCNVHYNIVDRAKEPVDNEEGKLIEKVTHHRERERETLCVSIWPSSSPRDSQLLSHRDATASLSVFLVFLLQDYITLQWTSPGRIYRFGSHHTARFI